MITSVRVLSSWDCSMALALTGTLVCAWAWWFPGTAVTMEPGTGLLPVLLGLFTVRDLGPVKA